MYVLVLVVREEIAEKLANLFPVGLHAELNSKRILLILDFNGIRDQYEVERILCSIKKKYGEPEKEWIMKYLSEEGFLAFCDEVNTCLSETTEENRKVLEDAGMIFN